MEYGDRQTDRDRRTNEKGPRGRWTRGRRRMEEMDQRRSIHAHTHAHTLLLKANALIHLHRTLRVSKWFYIRRPLPASPCALNKQSAAA